ncbi:zinc finger protein 761-like [Lutzomyia longipalpis]|uniref:zinc finger protein 761-like n=1 Tax=Lutzomyia longipalpis TaxID=7200 RepID=UPI0024841A0A|nr:zinc finger protein 761-like [Lutzomyia longipalpis]
MLANWQNWCRLCGKDDFKNEDIIYKIESIREQLEIVKKYFLISVLPLDGVYISICSDCSTFLMKVDDFRKHCTKVDQMFNELLLKKDFSDDDLQAIRYKFGVDTEEKFITHLSQELNEEEKKDIPVPDYSSDPLDTDYHDTTEVSEVVKEEPSEELNVVRGKRGRPRKSTIPSRKPQRLTAFRKVKAKEKSFENEGSEEEPSTEKLPPKEQKKRGRKAAERECKICSKKFTRLMGLKNHILAIHRKNEMPLVCSKCPKRFVSKTNLKMHEISHLPDEERLIFSCSHCGKKFSKKSNLKIHINSIHTKDKLFICEECGKSFNTKGGLYEHRVVHTDEHPFHCSFCPKQFKNTSAKKRHEEIHADIKHECSYCGIKLKTRRTLRLHMVVHSDKKNYKCNYCGNEYKRAKTLKDHLFLHTGQRPYECPFCDKTFSNNSNCRSHKKKDHPLELAALEATGQQQRVTHLPRLEDLQSKMLEHWQNWCRFCARQDYTNEDGTIQDLELVGDKINIVKEYFLITLLPFDEIQYICNDCSAFLERVDHFRDNCVKVEHMFSELMRYRNMTDVEIQALRAKFGFDSEDLTTLNNLYSQPLNEESDVDTVMAKEYNNPDEVIYQEIVVVSRDQLEAEEIDVKADPVPVKLERTKSPQLENSMPNEKKMKIEKESEDEMETLVEVDEAEEVDEVVEEEKPVVKKSPRKRKKKEVKPFKAIREKVCKICYKVFISYSGLTNHMITKHPTDDQETYACPQCPKEFISRRSWRKHQMTHLSPEEKLIYSCEFCEKKFTAKSTLKTHIDSFHEKKTLFVCDVCGKSCNTKGALMQHRLVHSDDYPYECSYCGKKFKFLPDKRRHEEIHTDTKYECPHCGLMLNTKRNLRLHKAVHSDERKYKCNYCGHEFKRPAALKHHLLQHTGQRPYKCLFCEKSFTNNVNCKGHQKKKHPDEWEAFVASGQQQQVTKLPKLEELQTMLETPEYLEETIELHVDHLY